MGGKSNYPLKFNVSFEFNYDMYCDVGMVCIKDLSLKSFACVSRICKYNNY